MEIERKFWIKESNLPLKYNKMSLIEQCYINKPDDFYEIRLRKYHNEDRYYLEFKSKGDIIREEFGTKITEEQYNNILKGIDPCHIKENSLIKRRYYLDQPGLFYDEYDGFLKGLNILEFEGNLEEVENFKLPEPFTNGIEVTEDYRFKNRYIVGKTHEFIKSLDNIYKMRIFLNA